MINELTSPESKLMLKYLIDVYSPSSITPYVYTGDIIGSDIATYDANIVYFGLSIVPGSENPTNAPGIIFFYNETNTLFYALSKNSMYYNTTSSSMYVVNENINLENIFFNRISSSGSKYDLIKFIGYKLVIP